MPFTEYFQLHHFDDDHGGGITTRFMPLAIFRREFGELRDRLAVDRTTISAAMVDIAGLSFLIGAGETFSFDAYLTAGCNGIGGAQFSVAIPAGATMRTLIAGQTSLPTAFTASAIVSSDEASQVLCNAIAQGRMVEMHGCVTNGESPGFVRPRFKSVTAGQVTTVSSGSYLVARKHN